MKIVKVLMLLLLIGVSGYAAKLKSGDELITKMYETHSKTWYKTLTFVQKTSFYKEDGTSTFQMWYEAMSLPGKLRIDIAPFDKMGGMLFADGKLNSFRDGKLARSTPFVHPLLVLGFDVYGQAPAETIKQLKELKIDLSIIREDKWQDRSVFVVGAKKGDFKTPQFWIDKKNLYFVRLIQPTGKDNVSVQEIQFNRYRKIPSGGWISPEVVVMVDSKLTQKEEYDDIQTNVVLDPKLFQPESWTGVKRDYFEIKSREIMEEMKYANPTSYVLSMLLSKLRF